MAQFRHSPFESTLEIVATLREGSIRSSIKARREHEDLLRAVVQAYRGGVSVNDLSDASGLRVEEILAAASKPAELADLAGNR